MNLKPFVKIAWNSNKERRQWREVIQKAGQLSFQVEYETVKRGLRQVNVYHIDPQCFDEQIEKVVEDGLVFLPILRSRKYSGFSHQHYPVEKLDINCFVYGAIAHDLETAKKFREASRNGDHITQGMLLGYPKCCCEFFQNAWIKQKALDPCYETGLNTEGYNVNKGVVHIEGNPLLNQMLRYFGLRITPFFPCSFKCPEAIKIGEQWFDLMNKLDSNTAETIKSLLKAPLTWSLHKSIIEVTTPHFRGIVNGYDCERKELEWNAS